MTNLPWFPFYVLDWLSDDKVAMMTPAQEGAYIRLLCYAWKDHECGLDDNDDELAMLSRLGEEWSNGAATVIRRCFKEHPESPGRLHNPRLYAEWLKSVKKSNVNRLKGKKGGLASAQAKAQARAKQGSSYGLADAQEQLKQNSTQSHSQSHSESYTDSGGVRVESGEELPTETTENIDIPPEGTEVTHYLIRQVEAHTMTKIQDRDRRGWYQIVKVMAEKGIDYARQMLAINGYDGHYGDRFWPVINTAWDWDLKFLDIEVAVKKESQPAAAGKTKLTQAQKDHYDGLVEDVQA